MSYILDALTKSDQERQRGAAPNLNTRHLPPAPEQKNVSRWLYVFAGALSAAILWAAWLHAWKPQSESPPRQPVASQQAQPKPDARAETAPDTRLPTMQPATARHALVEDQPKVPDAAPNPPAPRHDKPALAKVDQPRDVARKVTQPADAKGSPRVTQPVRTAAPATNPAPAEPQPRPVSVPRSASRILNMAELPLPIQREMPKILVSGISHSADPNGRLAIINDRVVREGDEVAAGLKVEQISMDGLIFSYQGYRFRGGAF